MRIALIICFVLFGISGVLAQGCSLANLNLPSSFSQVFPGNIKMIDSVNFSSDDKLGTAIFIELGGKGVYSANIEFRIKDKHRISIGLTSLDYEVGDKEYNLFLWLSPNVMYYYLIGKRNSFLEVGAGISIFPRWDLKIIYPDSPITVHGVIGYRYQKKNGFLFRAGLTPLYRVHDAFFPIIGLSFGYSW
jgi:hypothetical protein